MGAKALCLDEVLFFLLGVMCLVSSLSTTAYSKSQRLSPMSSSRSIILCFPLTFMNRFELLGVKCETQGNVHFFSCRGPPAPAAFTEKAMHPPGDCFCSFVKN